MDTKLSDQWKRARCIEDWCMVPKDEHELAILKNDEPDCEANIGRLVAVLGEEVRGVDSQLWVPVMPMDRQPWALLNSQGKASWTINRQVWVRIRDLLSTGCFAPNTMVPGLGKLSGYAKLTDWATDESRWRCKPGDLVIVGESPWYPGGRLPPEMKAQLGRIGIVLGRDEGEYDRDGWCWSVLCVNGTQWQNEYSVNGRPYTVEEPVMVVHDERLTCLVPANPLPLHEEE